VVGHVRGTGRVPGGPGDGPRRRIARNPRRGMGRNAGCTGLADGRFARYPVAGRLDRAPRPIVPWMGGFE